MTQSEIAQVIDLPATGRPPFVPFPKIPRLFRDIVITEKIDGTNAAVRITDDGQVFAQSRKRYLPTGPRGLDDENWRSRDNHGFGQWVADNSDQLAAELGPGLHFGEWWGNGINRGYGLPKGDRRFSLFNTERWEFADFSIPGLDVVPVLYEGPFDEWSMRSALSNLATNGSRAVPGYTNPEGIVIYHTAGKHLYKVTYDDGPKGGQAPPLAVAA